MASSSEPTSARLTGSCLCGTITYTLSNPAQRSVLCHCMNCKKSSGSSFMANDWHSQSDLTITSGSSSLKTYIDGKLDSSGELHRQFCGECGSPLFIQTSKFPGGIVVATGTRNEIGDMMKEWKPKEQYFCGKKMGWIPEIEGSKTYNAMT